MGIERVETAYLPSALNENFSRPYFHEILIRDAPRVGKGWSRSRSTVGSGGCLCADSLGVYKVAGIRAFLVRESWAGVDVGCDTNAEVVFPVTGALNTQAVGTLYQFDLCRAFFIADLLRAPNEIMAKARASDGIRGMDEGYPLRASHAAALQGNGLIPSVVRTGSPRS